MANVFFSFRLVAACVLFAAVILLLTVEESEGASHFVSYTYYVSVSHYNCYPYSYTYCYNWWYYNYWWWGWYWYRPYYWGWYWNPWYGYWGYWNWCYTRTYYNCYYTYTLEQRTGQQCAAKWVGSNCDIPTCTNPTCSAGMVCSDVDKCTCAGTSGATANCQIVPCSPTSNCYPGTCENNVCKCPIGFNGTNCEQIQHTPTITTCSVSLSAGTAAAQVAQASCAAPGSSPIIVWVNGAGLTITNNPVNDQSTGYGLQYLNVKWTPSYQYPFNLPTRPPSASTFFISNAPVPIYLTDAYYTLTFPDSGTGVTTGNIQCNLPTGTPTQYDCNVNTPWSNLNVNNKIGHNKTVIVNIAAKLGGYKTGDSTYTYNGQTYGFARQDFNGVPVTYSAAFRFDLVRPAHCLLNATNPRTCTAYPIYLDQDIRTNPAISPQMNGWEDDGSGIASYSYQVFYMQPDAYGVLSPVGNAYPDSVASLSATNAGNYHFTVPVPGVYSLIVTAYDYANNSAVARKIFNYINSPSYKIDSTQPVYLQEANPNANYSFITNLINPLQANLVWTGRFKPTDQWQTVFAARVNPLGASNGYTIDDVYGTQFGQRSLAAHDNKTGISSYTVRWYVDPDHGGVYAQPDWADNTTTMTVSTEMATLDLPQPLASGSALVVWLTATGVTSDNTTYKIVTHVDTSPPNITDATFFVNGGDNGFSTFVLTVFDKQGGINATNYMVVDVLNNNNVIIPSTWSVPSTRLFPSKKKKRAIVQPCTTSDTTCYCTPFQMCYDYVQTITINNCNFDRYKDRNSFHLQLQYWVYNLAGTASQMNVIDLGDISAVVCRNGGISGGAIAGIVIGCILGFLILICLIILIVVIIIRLTEHKHPIPSRNEMRTYAGHVRNRLTMRHAERSANNEIYAANVTAAGTSYGHKNNAYKSDPDDDMYVDKTDFDKFKISKKQVQFGDVLAEGRFAVVRRGYYMKTNDKQSVAIKALKVGFSQQDELLMTKKVAFMKNVPQHGNLVAFYGFIDENDGQGPIMVLDLCDYPLTNWLERITNLTADDLEQMLIFALNIAQGVQHLHNNKIIHRRLAARNVLLKQQVNGLVAKVIGYGPTAEDAQEDGAGPGTGVAVPKKWLAPETLDTCNTRNPTYNEKTDAWSYGVTLWEIYSQGAAPYKDVKSNDIHNLVKRGKRLQRPVQCPDEIFNEVMQPCWAERPGKRPSFNKILEQIQKFRSGTEQNGEYYAANDNGGEMYANAR